jgi:hypothetical protein
MPRRLALALLALAAPPAGAQQDADTTFTPPIEAPTYPPGRGPVVVIDEGHANFHTAGGRYRPFAELLRRDGYIVRGSANALHAAGLDGVRVLVVANALGTVSDTTNTSGPAFTAAEVRRLRQWVEQGGALFLIADHMPFPAAARPLAEAFGFEFTDGFAAGAGGGPDPIVFSRSAGTLRDHPILRGRTPAERIDSVVSFTGQAFRGAGATPLLVLGPDAVNLLPRKPWEFDSTTIRRSAAGWWQGAVKEVGRGRVVVFGEAAMFTAQLAGPQRTPVGMNHPSAAQNPRLLLNLFRWMAT